MRIRLLWLSMMALLVALTCQLPTARAQDDWERHRERYAHWLDTEWQEQPVPPVNQSPPATARWQPQPPPQQDPYRHHAWYGLTGNYYPRSIAPVIYAPYRAGGGDFTFTPLLGPYRYDPTLLDDDICSVLGIDPLDCACN